MKTTLAALLLLAIAVNLIGCPTSAGGAETRNRIIADNPFQAPCVQTEFDEFKGIKSVVTRCNHLSVPGHAGKVHIYLNAIATENRDGMNTFALVVTYDGPSWVFISSGESLVLMVDGKPVAFKGTGSGGALGHRHVDSAYSVREMASYITSLDTIKAIANANSVKGRLYCDRWPAIDAGFTQRNFGVLRQFVAAVENTFAHPATSARPEHKPGSTVGAANPSHSSAQPIRQKARMGFALKSETDGLVDDVQPGSPCERAGLTAGCRLLTLNGKEFSQAAIESEVRTRNPGDKVLVEWLDKAGNKVKKEIALEAP